MRSLRTAVNVMRAGSPAGQSTFASRTGTNARPFQYDTAIDAGRA